MPRRSRTSSRAIRRRRCGSSTATRSYVSELDALIAYLQMLGTLVDFATFDAAGPNLR